MPLPDNRFGIDKDPIIFSLFSNGDEDNIPIPPGTQIMITEGGNTMITESGNTMITE